MKRLTRRSLFQGAAGFSLALPWFESLALDAAPPRRVVFCFTANGDHADRRMKTQLETGFVFDDMLMPFNDWRDQIIVLDGVDKYHNKLPPDAQADAHQQGGSALAPWSSGSGSFPLGGVSRTTGYVLGPSADRAIGDRVLGANPNMPYKNLVYRVGDSWNDIWNTHSHAGPEGTQAPISPETSPFNAYKALFSNLSPDQDAALKRRLAMRASSLDLLGSELEDLKPKLSSADRIRLEQHTESVREIERSIAAVGHGAACAPFSTGTSFNVQDSTRYKDVGYLFFKIIAMAFACDLTRSSQFNWSGNTNGRTYKALGMTEGHHTISHNSDEDSLSKIRLIKQHLFELSCQLHTELKALPEAGGTVFDNTLVVHWSELSQGNTHARNNDLVVLASGTSNYFRMGRYLNVRKAARRSFSDVLVSCFHYMGFTDVSTFGEPALGGGGPLPNLV